jgi:hypothetical protein
MESIERVQAVRLGHLIMYVDRLINGSPRINRDETFRYMTIWTGMKGKAHEDLNDEEKREFTEAIDLGWEEEGSKGDPDILLELLSIGRSLLVGSADALLEEFAVGLLTPSRVRGVLTACMISEPDLPKDVDPAALPDHMEFVTAGSRGFVFDKRALGLYRGVVKEMLDALLPGDAYRDAEGKEWGDREHVQTLFALGIAVGLVTTDA